MYRNKVTRIPYRSIRDPSPETSIDNKASLQHQPEHHGSKPYPTYSFSEYLHVDYIKTLPFPRGRAEDRRRTPILRSSLPAALRHEDDGMAQSASFNLPCSMDAPKGFPGTGIHNPAHLESPRCIELD